MKHVLVRWLFAFAAIHSLALAAAPLEPKVEAEEDVYQFESADNGSGPMWCHGSTCLARSGENLFASGLEVLRDAKPLNNCRWLLFSRGPGGWKRVPTADTGRTREPSPLAAFADGRLILSANPTLLTNRTTYSGPAQPELLQFSAADPAIPFRRLTPGWEGHPAFTEHSYRSLAADGPAGELILLQNIDYTHAEWSFFGRDGQWSARGKLPWPAESGKPIRVCYPNVAIQNRAVHFCGVSDIVEPNTEWRAFKKQLTGQQWDYAFRRLFYTWSTDIARDKFRDWVELANFDRTAGSITPGDLWVAPDGAVHILWTERALDERLREKFFPGEKQRHALKHAVLRDGKVLATQTVLEAAEGGAAEIPGRGRFQVTPENRLFAVFYVGGRTASGQGVSENRAVELLADGSLGTPARIPLKSPMNDFYTATVRAGSPPSRSCEMFGPRSGSANTMGYARVRLY